MYVCMCVWLVFFEQCPRLLHVREIPIWRENVKCACGLVLVFFQCIWLPLLLRKIHCSFVLASSPMTFLRAEPTSPVPPVTYEHTSRDAMQLLRCDFYAAHGAACTITTVSPLGRGSGATGAAGFYKQEMSLGACLVEMAGFLSESTSWATAPLFFDRT